MRKHDELTFPNSCLNKADDREYVFVLRGKDIIAPAAIRFWVQHRIEAGKNKPDDMQIVEALDAADTMEAERGGDVRLPVGAEDAAVDQYYDPRAGETAADGEGT